MDILVSLGLNVAGGLIAGALTCWYFYRLAGKDLKREADRLRNLNRIIIKALEDGGYIEVNRDSEGNPIGIVYRVQASGGVTVGGSSQPIVQHHVTGSGGVRLGGSAIVEVTRADGTQEGP